VFRTRDVWGTTTIYCYLHTLTRDPFATTCRLRQPAHWTKDYWNMRASIYLSKAIFHKNFRRLHQSVCSLTQLAQLSSDGLIALRILQKNHQLWYIVETNSKGWRWTCMVGLNHWTQFDSLHKLEIPNVQISRMVPANSCWRLLLHSFSHSLLVSSAFPPPPSILLQQ